ncbi:zinc finger protein 318 [Anomaloglossus baeobatrachus]|uniref:zinc finger protein 318 n=1 Tax=Anomaloglossus baeobatrachus TaxID=238106 RepID=UPI003F4FE786
MHRTPGRRALSPDSPGSFRDSPRSRQDRSWSRGHSPSRRARSPDRRGRSRSRPRQSPVSPSRRALSPSRRALSPSRRALSPSRRSRSPSRRSRSPSRRSRSPSRRSRSPDRRGRSRSRPGGRSRSKSRGRAGRSRSRPRQSPVSPSRRSPDRRGRSRSRPRQSPVSPSRRSPDRRGRSRPRQSPVSRYRRRSPQLDYRHERRPSPSYRSSPASERRSPDHRPLTQEHDRSSDVKVVGNDSLHSAALPMPKKSILKKRPDVESSSCDQSPQVDMFSSSQDVRSVKNNLTTESSVSMVVKMGLLTSSSSSSSALAAVEQNPKAPPPHGGTPLTVVPTSWTLNSSADFGRKGNIMDKSSPCEPTDSPKMNLPFSSTIGKDFTKSSTKSQPSPLSGGNVFPEQKAADEPHSFLLPHEQEYKSSPLSNKTPDMKQRSSTEIEDEERFLYGDEEEKPKQKKAPSDQKASAPPAKSSEDKQEFEKIHDLLKTIGLDIGVAEIGKLAIRTQERLHGKTVAPKTTQPPAEQPHSKPTTPSVQPKAKVPKPKANVPKPQVKAEAAVKAKPLAKPVTKALPTPIPKDKPKLILKNPLPNETIAAPKVEEPIQPPISCPVPEPTPPPISPSQIPVYPGYSHPPMVHGYSMPPNYNPYTPYGSYPTSSWTMYPPMPPPPPPAHMQTPPPPPISAPFSAPTPTPVYNPRSNLRIIETTEDLTDAKAIVKTEPKPTTSLGEWLAKQESDRKNKESEKLKVLEELDSVRKEHKVKSESLKTLSTKVEQLRIQQGILLRKKRREKDGHKDPLLEELNNVLESAQKQISSLSEEISTTKQKQQQLTKVAEILGVSPAELTVKSAPKKEEGSPGSPPLPRDSNNESRISNDSSKSGDHLKSRSDPGSDAKAKSSSLIFGADAKLLGDTHLPNVTKKSEVKCKGTPVVPHPDPKSSPEPHSPHMSKSRDKSRSKSPRPTTPSSKTATKSEEPLPFDLSDIFEYYDSGSHWCEDCNEICLTLPEFLLHLHNKKHSESIKEVKRPWMKKKPQEPTSTMKQKVNIPLKGPEFVVPVSGYYCGLCEEMFPDHIAGEEHLKAYAHNDKYKKHIDMQINYEVTRREKKKASLTAAQELDRKIADHKRKIQEQKFEVPVYKSKRARKEDEKRAKSKHHISSSPHSTEQKRNKTPEKEPSKNTTFGKFAWKTAEKTQAAVNSADVEAAPIKPKEEESKTLSLKPKGFVIKLLGKPSALPGNALSPSHSTASTTVTSTASPTSTSAAPTSTSTTQTKVRPNLPGLVNVRLPTPQVTMSKPAPLNTFLSIRSSNTTSKSIPIVKNKPSGGLPEDLVSKAFGGEVVVLKKSAQPESKAKTPSKELEKTAGQSAKTIQVKKGQELFNKKETVEKQGVKNEKESSVSKPSSSWFSQKSDPVPKSTSHTNIFGPIRPTASPGPSKVQHSPNTKSPVTNAASSPISSPKSAISSVNKSTSSLSNYAKSDGSINPTNPQTDKAGPTLRTDKNAVQTPKETTPGKSKNETPQEVKTSVVLRNPTTGQQEHLLFQQTNDEDTNDQNLQKTKPMPAEDNYENRDKPESTPPLPMQKAKPTFNATTKLNQKFKKAPLSLPTSLFGHVQDAGCKDIKITSIEAQKPNYGPDKRDSPLIPPTIYSPANPIQQELDSYYKLIASEDDPEDLTTSEDQDSEVALQPTNVTTTPLQTRVESPTEQKVQLERPPALVKTPIRPVVPDLSGDDVDDSDMACEVPDATLSSVAQTSGWKPMKSSFTLSGSQHASGLASGKASMKKDQSKERQMTTTSAPENSMEDLSVCVTCDSD